MKNFKMEIQFVCISSSNTCIELYPRFQTPPPTALSHRLSLGLGRTDFQPATTMSGVRCQMEQQQDIEGSILN